MLLLLVLSAALGPLELLARACAAAAAPGIGGATILGGLPIPIPVPVPPLPPPPPPDEPVDTTIGALRSFVTAFRNLMPLVISVFRAPCLTCQQSNVK
jgi:hypothetical protein